MSSEDGGRKSLFTYKNTKNIDDEGPKKTIHRTGKKWNVIPLDLKNEFGGLGFLSVLLIKSACHQTFEIKKL